MPRPRSESLPARLRNDRPKLEPDIPAWSSFPNDELSWEDMLSLLEKLEWWSFQCRWLFEPIMAGEPPIWLEIPPELVYPPMDPDDLTECPPSFGHSAWWRSPEEPGPYPTAVGILAARLRTDRLLSDVAHELSKLR